MNQTWKKQRNWEFREPVECALVFDLILINHADAKDDAREVAQIEDVVALRRCGQQGGHRVLVDIQGGRHDGLPDRDEVSRKPLLSDVGRSQ